MINAQSQKDDYSGSIAKKKNITVVNRIDNKE